MELDVPNLDLTAPTFDLSGIDPHKPIVDRPDMDLPDVDVNQPNVSVEGGSGLLDAAKAAVMAGGVGLVARAASALTVDDKALPTVSAAVDGDADATNWLLSLIKQVKGAYQGHNHRAVSHLWDSSSAHDCSTLSDYESISLQPATYDKLGFSHCGVPMAGFVAVGGDVGNLEPGCGILFHYCNIVVCRDADDTHHFIRVVAD